MKALFKLHLIGLLSLFALIGCASVSFDGGNLEDMAYNSSVIIGVENGHGSGVIIGKNYVLTAKHVVEGEKVVAVKFNDGRKPLPGTVAFVSPDTDFAVVKVDTGTAPIAPLACHVAPTQGEPLMAYGDPIFFENLATYGYVSSRGVYNVEGAPIGVVIINMLVNPGDSGGAIWSRSRNKVVGIGQAFLGMPNKYGVKVPTGISTMIGTQIICKELKGTGILND